MLYSCLQVVEPGHQNIVAPELNTSEIPSLDMSALPQSQAVRFVLRAESRCIWPKAFSSTMEALERYLVITTRLLTIPLRDY